MPRLVIGRFDVRFQARIEVHLVDCVFGIIPVVTVYLIVLSSSLISCLVTTGGSSGTGAGAGVAAGCAEGGKFGGLCCGACCANERRVNENSKASDSSVDLSKSVSSNL